MRYFTLCEFTPSRKTYRKNHERIWAGASSGFLFHDTENPLSIEDIRKALYHLAPLHKLDETSGRVADSAIAVRVDENTIAATFSMRAMPKPAAVMTYTWGHSNPKSEWLSTNKLTGWQIPSVKDARQPAVPVDFSDLYDACEQLPRLMGMCPCPMRDTGECLKTHVWDKFPEQYQDVQIQTSDFDIDTRVFNRVAYKTVGGFQYTSSSTTADVDFVEGMRPWDNHNFEVVDTRKRELSARGKYRHVREKARKSKCAECTFSLKLTYKKNAPIKDCGYLNSCDGGSTVDQAYVALYSWLDNQSGLMSLPGFTAAQRDYLIRMSGRIFHARILYESRSTKTVFGGFFKRNDSKWCYWLSAGAGDLSEKRGYETFDELAAVLSKAGVPLPDVLPDTKPVPRNVLLMCALLGSRSRITQQYQGFHPLRTVIAQFGDDDASGYVTAEAASNNYINIRQSLSPHSDVSKYIDLHPEWSYPQVAREYRAHQAREQDERNKRHLPVITG